jgi:PAS domain S-box-containing protein
MNFSPNILIVDDLEVNLMLLENILKKIKITPIRALSGEEALKKIEGVELALAILDVRMSGMDGYELAGKINENRQSQKVPIIFITANHLYDMEEFEGYKSGAVDYIYKPINYNILLSKINVFIDLFNQKNAIARNADLLEKSTVELTNLNTALQLSEEKYKTMLDASLDGIVLIRMNGVISEVSDIGLKLFGVENREDIVDKHFSEFVGKDEKGSVKEIIGKTTNDGVAQNIELLIRRQDQSLFLSEVSSTLIKGIEGEPVSFMISIRDISKRKEIETKQYHADRMVSLGEMAAGIAHEINQPLIIISMVTDKILYESGKSGIIDIEFFKNKSEIIFENITRIKNIIDHIRAFSSSHEEYLLTAFDINSSITNATSMFSAQFQHASIELNIKLEKNLSPILGNTYKFEQVLINLLNNAKDAVLEKKNKTREDFEMIIGIKSYWENQFIIVEITDNGIGIDNAELNNIILPFYTTKEEGKGTGLGLSISYQIIKEMNGSIEIISEKLIGTKIKLVLDTRKEIQNGK